MNKNTENSITIEEFLKNIKSSYHCPECNESINITQDLEIECKNLHKTKITLENSETLLANMTKDLPNFSCCIDCKAVFNENNKEFIYCLNDKSLYCFNCYKSSHSKYDHLTINSSNIFTNCHVHSETNIAFCINHKVNICGACELNEHLNCEIIEFRKIFPSEDNIKELQENINKKINNILPEYNNLLKIEDIINKHKKILKNKIAIIKLYQTIINSYKGKKYNYHFISNLNNIISTNEIKKIKDDKSPNFTNELIEFLESRKYKIKKPNSNDYNYIAFSTDALCHIENGYSSYLNLLEPFGISWTAPSYDNGNYYPEAFRYYNSGSFQKERANLFLTNTNIQIYGDWVKKLQNKIDKLEKYQKGEAIDQLYKEKETIITDETIGLKHNEQVPYYYMHYPCGWLWVKDINKFRLINKNMVDYCNDLISFWFE